MINLTPVASTKVKEIMQMQSPVPVALRVAVVGGGCSGFQYHMAFENQTNETDELLDFNGLKVAVDQMSSMYLEGVEIDYIESVEGAGFKFNNPNVKSTCGCGSSFSVEFSAVRGRGVAFLANHGFQAPGLASRSLFSCDPAYPNGMPSIAPPPQAQRQSRQALCASCCRCCREGRRWTSRAAPAAIRSYWPSG